MLRTHYSKDINAKHHEKKVVAAGWVRAIREVGGIKFLVLADRFGTVQVTVKKDAADAKLTKQLLSINREDVISVKGTVKINEKAPNGCEIIPDSIAVLGKAEVPLPMETDARIQSELDTRIDNRFIDMRNPKVRSIFRIKDVIQRSFVRYLESHDFVLFNTPAIVAAATEGGTDLFPISYFENEAFLSQSPQLYKQILMATGIDKVAIVTPVFRAEKHNTTYHLNESMQMDIECAFIEDEEDVLKHLDGVLHFIYDTVKKTCREELEILERKIDVPKLPIKRLTYTDAVKIGNIKWGEDLTPEAQRHINKKFSPVIITKWPTDVRAFYAMPEAGNEKVCRAYDMIIDGIEICSGAQRIHDYNQLVSIMKARKMNPKNFEFYLKAFRYGMPPHAGWSIGLERLTMVITGVKNIRECVLFPRDRKRLTP